MSAKAVAIIPARGGSKRIPRKNIRPFEGKPIIAYSIEAARASGCFDTILVSTDDPQIAEVARSYGADVPFMRSDRTSDDHSGLAEVAAEVIAQCESQGDSYETFCCILATAPFVTGARIKEGAALLESTSMDAVVPVVRFSYPPQRGFRMDQNNRASMVSPEHYQSRSQDLEPIYHDSGQFYWMRTAALKNEMRFFAERTAALVLSEIEVQDIDSEEDWQMAELKYRLLRAGVK